MFLLVLMVILCFLVVMHAQWANDKEREEEFRKQKEKEELERANAIREAYERHYNDEMAKLGVTLQPPSDTWCWLSFSSDRFGVDSEKNLFIIPPPLRDKGLPELIMHGSHNISEITFKPVEYEKIAYDDIVFFTKEGDVTYTTEVSGGGVCGGGSSLTGAIVGGAIAGNTGAIIGSRKEVTSTPIKSRTVRHDDTRTRIRYKVGNQYKECTFDGFRVYDYLITVIGDKDLLQMQLNQMRKPTR